MRKVIADEWMTLDGVIQAPGQANEDTAGDFQHGGWHVGYFDDLAQRWVVDSVVTAGGFLLGAAPSATDCEDPPAPLNDGVAPQRCKVVPAGLRAEGALSTMRSRTGPRDAKGQLVWR